MDSTTNQQPNNLTRARKINLNPLSRDDMLLVFQKFDTISMALMYLKHLNTEELFLFSHPNKPIRRYELPFSISFCHKVTYSGQPSANQCRSVEVSSDQNSLSDDSECLCDHVKCDLSMPMGMAEEYYYSLLYGHIANEVDEWKDLLYYVSSEKNREMFITHEEPGLIQYLSMTLARLISKFSVRPRTNFIGGMFHLFSFKICLGDISMRKTSCVRCWRSGAVLWGHPSQWNNFVTHSIPQMIDNTIVVNRFGSLVPLSSHCPEYYIDGLFVPVYDVYGSFSYPPMCSVSKKKLNHPYFYGSVVHDCSKSSLVVLESETSLRDKSPYPTGRARGGK